MRRSTQAEGVVAAPVEQERCSTAQEEESSLANAAAHELALVRRIARTKHRALCCTDERAAACPVCMEEGEPMVTFDCTHQSCESCASRIVRVQVEAGSV